MELRERFNKHMYYANNRPDNNELAAHIHKYQYDFDKGKNNEKIDSPVYWTQKHLRDIM